MIEWLNLIITAVAFLIIFLHQKHKIKNLSDQISSQQNLFNNMKSSVDVMKAYVDSINPTIFAEMRKQYKELVDKELEIETKTIEQKHKDEVKSIIESRDKSAEMVADLSVTLYYILPYFPKEGMEMIVNRIENMTLRKLFFEKWIPRAEMLQLEARKQAAKQFASGGIESKLGTQGNAFTTPLKTE